MEKVFACSNLQLMTLATTAVIGIQFPQPAFGADSNLSTPDADSFRLESFGHGLTGPVDTPTTNVTTVQSPGYEAARARFERRRKTNDLLEVSYQLLSIVDLAQTLDCMHKHRCSESNPFLGRHPSDGTLIAFKAGVGVTHFLIHRLIRKHPRDDFIFEVATNVVQGTVVGLNMRYAFK